MPKAIFVSPQGQESEVDIPSGWSLMEGAREHGVNGIVAECGGGAICGTCHVQVDGAWFAHTGTQEMGEEALLEVVPERVETSRLACQVIMSDELDGIRVTIPSEQLGF